MRKSSYSSLKFFSRIVSSMFIIASKTSKFFKKAFESAVFLLLGSFSDYLPWMVRSRTQKRWKIWQLYMSSSTGAVLSPPTWPSSVFIDYCSKSWLLLSKISKSNVLISCFNEAKHSAWSSKSQSSKVCFALISQDVFIDDVLRADCLRV